HGATEDDIFDLCRIQLRDTFECTLDCHGSQFIGTGGPECALKSTAHWGTNGRGNNNFIHGNLVSLEAIAVCQVLNQKHRSKLEPSRRSKFSKEPAVVRCGTATADAHGESSSESQARNHRFAT